MEIPTTSSWRDPRNYQRLCLKYNIICWFQQTLKTNDFRWMPNFKNSFKDMGSTFRIACSSPNVYFLPSLHLTAINFLHKACWSFPNLHHRLVRRNSNFLHLCFQFQCLCYVEEATFFNLMQWNLLFVPLTISKKISRIFSSDAALVGILNRHRW